MWLAKGRLQSKSAEEVREINKSSLVIQEVIDHYSKKSSDTIKLKAALWLTDNIPGHFSYTHSIIADSIKLQYSKLHQLIVKNYYLNDRQYPVFTDEKEMEIVATSVTDLEFENYVEEVRNWLLNYHTDEISSHHLEDSKVLSSNWIIDHIDNAFKCWERSPYANRMNFNEFAETMLPYRYRNEMISMESSYINKVFSSVISLDNNLSNIIYDLNAYTFYADCFENNGKKIGELGFYDIMQFYQFECGRHSEWMARALNSVGIPANVDFTPSWLDRDRGHFWVSVRDSSGNYYPFTPKWQTLHDTVYFKKVSKVFRFTFSPQQGPFTNRVEGESIPDIFNTPYLKDVTAQYHPVSDVIIPTVRQVSNRQYAYLCIFAASGWKPIGWGKFDSQYKNVSFVDVPKGISYIVGTWENGKIVPCTDPFYLSENGKIKRITADPEKKIDIRVTRKFYEKINLINKMNETVGALVQCSMDSNFARSYNLMRISKTDLMEMRIRPVNVPNHIKALYVRIISPDTRILHLSELEIFSKDQLQRNHTDSFTEVQIYPTQDSLNSAKLLDKDVETFYSSKSVTYQLLKPIHISGIRLAPRTANNGIVKGNRYELMYYDNGWKSAGVQVAQNNHSLLFPAIPSTTIYWLKNLDRGKEEQAFQFVNGKQYFLNHDKFCHN